MQQLLASIKGFLSNVINKNKLQSGHFMYRLQTIKIQFLRKNIYARKIENRTVWLNGC